MSANILPLLHLVSKYLWPPAMSKALCSGEGRAWSWESRGLELIFSSLYWLRNQFPFLDLNFHICRMGLPSSVIFGWDLPCISESPRGWGLLETTQEPSDLRRSSAPSSPCLCSPEEPLFPPVSLWYSSRCPGSRSLRGVGQRKGGKPLDQGPPPRAKSFYFSIGSAATLCSKVSRWNLLSTL